MSYLNDPGFVPLGAALFRARLTSAYTLVSADVAPGANWAGMVAGTNIYGFLEQTIDVTTGLPADAYPGRQSYPAGNSKPTSAFALELSNALLTVPGNTPHGYTNAGPYVWMRLRESFNSVPVFEFAVPQVPYQHATCSTYTLTTSWSNVGLSVSLPAGSVWEVKVQINASISTSSSATSDSLSFRLYDGSAVQGAPVECCNAYCASVTFVDAATLIAIVNPTSAITLNVQGQINTSSASTGQLLGTSGSSSGSYLSAIRLA